MHWIVLPIVYELFLWWASTGLIIYLYRRPQRTFGHSFAGATLVLLAALGGIVAIRDDTSLAGAYLGLTCGTLAWGWQIAGFYLGIITGPRRSACPAGCRGLQHFKHGLQATLYHELASLVGAGVIAALTWGAANQLGLWMYLLLWLMHTVAKVNVFLGVRNFSPQLLPGHLRYLESFFTRRSMNLFFPFSLAGAVALAVLLLRHALMLEANSFAAIAALFLGCMLLLGILELCLLMSPPPRARRVRNKARAAPVEISGIAIGEND